MIGPILLGLIGGYLLSRQNVILLLLVFVMFRYRTKEKYEALYELFDTDFDFETYQGRARSYGSYHDFLLAHQEYRPLAAAIFIRYWDDITKDLIRQYLIILTLAYLGLGQHAIYFAVSLIMTQLAMMMHLYFWKNQRIDFYGSLMHNLVITDWMTDETLETNEV